MEKVILPPRSAGVWLECAECHRAISHGFQVCQHCGHVVSAEEQQRLRTTLRNNVSRYGLIAAIVFSTLFYFAYYLAGA